jgi:hypothetical protein
MSRETSPAVTTAARDWRRLFEAALLERDDSILPHRLKAAKKALMDRLTADSVGSTSSSEGKLLLAALNTISELQRLAKLEDVPPTQGTQALGHAA